MRNDKYRRRNSTVLKHSNPDTMDSISAACIDACPQLNWSRLVCVANLRLANHTTCLNFIVMFMVYLMTMSAAQAASR